MGKEAFWTVPAVTNEIHESNAVIKDTQYVQIVWARQSKHHQWGVEAGSTFAALQMQHHLENMLLQTIKYEQMHFPVRRICTEKGFRCAVLRCLTNHPTLQNYDSNCLSNPNPFQSDTTEGIESHLWSSQHRKQQQRLFFLFFYLIEVASPVALIHRPLCQQVS